jgi:hypothetical protein
VDRHELAHAVIHQLGPAGCDPPTLLVEGWAEAHAGMTIRKRAEWARQSRALWRERTGAGPERSYLRELTGPSWYHRIHAAIYNVGGAFAEFFVRKYGPERFLRLYFACRPGRFEQECVAQLGVEFDALESAFWAEVDQLAGGCWPTIILPPVLPQREMLPCGSSHSIGPSGVRAAISDLRCQDLPAVTAVRHTNADPDLQALLLGLVGAGRFGYGRRAG